MGARTSRTQSRAGAKYGSCTVTAMMRCPGPVLIREHGTPLTPLPSFYCASEMVAAMSTMLSEHRQRDRHFVAHIVCHVVVSFVSGSDHSSGPAAAPGGQLGIRSLPPCLTPPAVRWQFRPSCS
jgi:hypothetical protein